MAGKKPDYRVAALNKSTEAKGVIGAAWTNADGSIAVVLDPFVVLTQQNKNLLITLFPANGDHFRHKEREKPDDEIPF